MAAATMAAPGRWPTRFHHRHDGLLPADVDLAASTPQQKKAIANYFARRGRSSKADP